MLNELYVRYKKRGDVESMDSIKERLVVKTHERTTLLRQLEDRLEAVSPAQRQKIREELAL